MRFMLFVLSFITTSAVHAGSPVSGTVKQSASKYYLISDQASQCSQYAVETKSEEAATAVLKLSSGDMIIATGLFDLDTCTVILESVEYVGLKKLLGYWYTSSGLINVRDFSSLSFYPLESGVFDNDIFSSAKAPVDYRYSVTPSEGKEWVLFLSDRKSTTFATLQFTKESAVMKLYDSNTGKVTKVLHLSKWGNLR